MAASTTRSGRRRPLPGRLRDVGRAGYTTVSPCTLQNSTVLFALRIPASGVQDRGTDEMLDVLEFTIDTVANELWLRAENLAKLKTLLSECSGGTTSLVGQVFTGPLFEQEAIEESRDCSLFVSVCSHDVL